jgi:hypothetical protein
MIDTDEPNKEEPRPSTTQLVNQTSQERDDIVQYLIQLVLKQPKSMASKDQKEM